jgi:hypothetical protein
VLVVGLIAVDNWANTNKTKQNKTKTKQKQKQKQNGTTPPTR